MTSRTPHTVTRRRTRTLTVLADTTALAATPALAAHAAAPGAAPAVIRVSPYARTAADARIATKLTARVTTARFGTAFTGAVIDSASGTVVWSKNGNTGRMPASNTKW